MTTIETRESVGSIPGLLRQRVRATPHAEAFRYRDGAGWSALTWAQVDQQVQMLAAGMISLGIDDEERVSILSGTRWEWILADLAILTAGGATTTIYPSNTAEECAYIIADSDSVMVVAEDADQVAKLRTVRAEIPGVRHVVVIDGEPSDDDWVVTLEQVIERGREVDSEVCRQRVAGIGPERLATLIYTSGTTGQPKGVELVHDNWLYEAEAVVALDVLRPGDLHFLWLPMSHSFGKVLEVAMIAAGIPTAIDGRIEHIAENLAELQPTIVAGAPRIFEKIRNTILSTVERKGGITLALFRWAIRIGERMRATSRPGMLLRAQYRLADRLVFAKMRARLGGRIRYLVSGAAPLSEQVAEFFAAAGLIILEGYGLTETSAASFVNLPKSFQPGTVGPPLPGTDVSFAEDGEILIRGRGVMRGYHGMPEQTAATLVDGWLQTGDIGELDSAGRLRVTDRKKELIKTAGGKYVAPQYIEGLIKAHCPIVDNVLVHGDRRPYCVALVTVDNAMIDADTDVRAVIQRAIDEVNSHQPRFATVKKFAVVPVGFTVETGELTANLKLRRRYVENKYRDVLDSFYAETG